MAQKNVIANAILKMSYTELVEFANDLTLMQSSAIEDGWCWQPNQTHGEFGMAEMLHSWAESV